MALSQSLISGSASDGKPRKTTFPTSWLSSQRKLKPFLCKRKYIHYNNRVPTEYRYSNRENETTSDGLADPRHTTNYNRINKNESRDPMFIELQLPLNATANSLGYSATISCYQELP